VGYSRGRYPGGEAAHDEFGATLRDIRYFGKKTLNDCRRLRDLARAIGWSEYGIDSNIINAEEEHQSDQERKTLTQPRLRPFDISTLLTPAPTSPRVRLRSNGKQE